MARRRELLDVVNGMADHWMRDAPWEPDWWLGNMMRRARKQPSNSFTIVVAPGPPDSQTDSDGLVSALASDLSRHLGRRRMPPEWVVSLEVSVELRAPQSATGTPVRGRVTIVDDRGCTFAASRRTVVLTQSPGLARRIVRVLQFGWRRSQ